MFNEISAVDAFFFIAAAAYIYWLGCIRTQVKFGLLSIMTPEQYKNFTEIKLYVAKVIILLLLLVIFHGKING